jgi:hypothetical protein
MDVPQFINPWKDILASKFYQLRIKLQVLLKISFLFVNKFEEALLAL